MVLRTADKICQASLVKEDGAICLLCGVDMGFGLGTSWMVESVPDKTTSMLERTQEQNVVELREVSISS